MVERAAHATSEEWPGEGNAHHRPAGKAHHHGRAEADAFLNLTTNTMHTPAQESDSEVQGDAANGTSLLLDLVLVPLNMVAFLLSLAIVEYRQRQWRVSQHASHSEGLWARVTHWSPAEPYQDSRDGTWKRSEGSNAQQPTAPMFQGWVTQKKHRAVAKMELGDALELKGGVLVALAIFSAISLVALLYGIRHTYSWVVSG